MQLRAVKFDADGLVVVEDAAVVAIGAAPQGLKNESLCNETPLFGGFRYILWLTARFKRTEPLLDPCSTRTRLDGISVCLSTVLLGRRVADFAPEQDSQNYLIDKRQGNQRLHKLSIVKSATFESGSGSPPPGRGSPPPRERKRPHA